MKQYLLGLYQPDGTPPPPEVLDPIMRDLDRLHDEMVAAGVWVFTGRLHLADSATVVRRGGADVLVTDGPFAEGKEHLGGFVVIKVPDLDAALDWARRMCEASTLPIEVRPLQGEY
ncbi:MAG TPA: YciI family protein [Pseudonocardiaceae bacterium]|jgi:hypothetical protein|nr:YciI family protein [Pseudonocardiaceae bacterium]